MSQNEYYFDKAGEISGPVSANDLPSHGITRKTLIWKKGMEAWQSAEKVPELVELFDSMPPALPPRAVPPPIPISSTTKPLISPTGLSAILELFTGMQFSLPQFGQFSQGNIIFDDETGGTLVSFEEDELTRYREDVLNYNKSYTFNAHNEFFGLVFILFKPEQTYYLNLKRELHILDSKRKVLAICRAKGDLSSMGFSLKQDDAWIVVYTPAGDAIMQLNIRTVEGIACVEVQTAGRELAVVTRTEPNNVRRLFVDKPTDRYDIRFLAKADGLAKCITFGAVAAFDLFCAERSQKWK